MDSIDDVEVIDRRTSHCGFFRVDTVRLRHRRFDGGWTEVMTREVALRGRAVGVLPYDPATDRVVLIEQFRAGAWAAGQPPWMIEVVAGIVEEGEDDAAVARREAFEEAGLTVGELLPIAQFAPSPGGLTEWVAVFCGRVDATAVADGTFGVADEHEDIRAFAVSADEAIAMAADGRICNATSLIALQWLALNRAEVRRRWA